MRTIVIIDDDRTFADPDDSDVELVHLRTTDEALAYLSRYWTDLCYSYDADPISELWLDHDLGEGGTIRPVVQWLCLARTGRFPFSVDKIYVHSQNPSGAEWVVKHLAAFYPDVNRTALPKLKESTHAC